MTRFFVNSLLAKAGLFLSFCSTFLCFPAFAEGDVYFDYETMTLNTVGIYNSKTEDARSNTHSELIAWKHGIENLEAYFGSSCQGIDKTSLDVKKNWEDDFHHRQTEIFSNSVMAVTLQAPIKQVFRTSLKLRKALKTDEGDKIAFQLPKRLAAAAVRCGSIELSLKNKERIHIIPIDSMKKNTKNLKIIHLALEPHGLYLELDPAFDVQQESEILDNSSLVDIENLSSQIVPIFVAVDEKNEL